MPFKNKSKINLKKSHSKLIQSKPIKDCMIPFFKKIFKKSKIR